MKTYAIVLAGGQGLRMGAELPKQFLLLDGKPILMHAMEAFYKHDASISIILVLPKEQQEYWEGLCLQFSFTIPHQRVNGGVTRFQSVVNGLACIEGEGLIAVHDGVRPLVSTQLIHRCFQSAASAGAVVPVFSVVESLRRLDGNSSKSVDRSHYVTVQTPQTFQAEVLRKAYKQTYKDIYTDDASVVESAGFKVTLIEGERENIKITTPMDLILAEQLQKR